MGYQCNEHALYIDKDYIEEQTFDKMKQFFLPCKKKRWIVYLNDITRRMSKRRNKITGIYTAFK